MKRKMKLRTKLTIAILVLLMLFTCFTTACQPGEADMSEVQADEPQIEADNEGIATSSTTQLSFEAPTEPYTAPAHWTETVEDEKLTIEIDTDIILPETTKYPVARVEPLTLTQGMVDELVEYFAPNSKLYECPLKSTKADYEEQIEEVRKGECVDGEYVVTNNTEKLIEELKEKQDRAPVEAPKVYVDTTLTYRTTDPNGPREIEGGENFLWVAAERSGQRDSCFYVANYVEGYNNNVLFNYSERSYFTESTINRIMEAPEDYLVESLDVYTDLKAVLNGVALTKEEAQPHAEKVLNDLGIDYMRLVNVEKAVTRESYDEDTNISDPEMGGYVFEYMRDFGGMVGYVRNCWSGFVLEESPAYVEPFDYETVKIFVTEKGVQSFLWSGGVRVTEEISDSVKLLPFDQIQQAVIKQVRNKSTAPLAYGDDVKVKVASAELKMGYISTDDSKQALMVPVWVFNMINIDQVFKEYLIVINAIDGGVIHPYSPQEGIRLDVT